jgi:dipeptidyl aminopeptidase/acylaminoacyl peptidase
VPDPNPFLDPAHFTALPRLTSLACAPDGSRLVVGLQQPDDDGARYVTSLWSVDPGGGDPQRLTRSAQGESAPAFLPSGELVFLSGRPDGETTEQVALWLLPAGGEARVLARYPGGVGGPVVAMGTGSVLLSAARPVGAPRDGADERRTRDHRKITSILHTGMPIRYWDHELGDVEPRLLVVDGGEVEDLVPDAVFELSEAGFDVSADARRVVTTWSTRERGGRVRRSILVLDLPGGTRRIIEAAGYDLDGPKLAPSGERLALTRESDGDFDTPMTSALEIHELGSGMVVVPQLEDLFVTEYAWSPDGQLLYATGDWHGRGAVVALDPVSGAVVRRLACDAAYSNLSPGPGGRLYALRSTVDSPPTPVCLDSASADQVPAVLRSPAATPAPPGSVREVSARAPDGAAVRGWLCLPPESEQPAPLLLFIHGGPFASFNAWSWRWNPWVAVARGYAVLLPDPPLSTGYGPDWLTRAWPHRAGRVWADLECLLDAVVESAEIDAQRTACLGGSFGGYMTNWIAGHTERFDAIVTHAGLWALDQQHVTTDAAQWKVGLFGTVAEHPQWYAENSPNQFIDAITTPMLVSHGNRDYRVPVSEALRLWWDLVSRFDGEPAALPHRFLQFTSENHWVLSPGNAEVWYSTVLGFCDQHVRGRPSQLPAK